MNSIALVCVLGLMGVSAAIDDAECNVRCPLNYEPLCASDGRSYSNLCMMQTSGCLTRTELTVRHMGACDDEQPREEEESKTVSCTRACPLLYDPVCATNSVTYSNLCMMDVASCELKRQLEVAHKGACTGLKATLMMAPVPAEEDRVERADECKTACDRMYDPMCGTDGRTYSNRCLLELVACQERSNLAVAHTGEC